MSIITRRDNKIIVSYDMLFTMTVADEKISIRKATDPSPEDLAAFDLTAIKKLLLQLRDRKLLELEGIMESKFCEIAAREEAEENTPEELAKRKKRKNEEAALREERMRVYEKRGHCGIHMKARWPAGPLPEHNGYGRAEKKWQEMQEVAKRRSRYKAEREALRQVEAQAKAAIIAAHRL